MTSSTADLVAELRALVEHAKAVPMSASCMVNRADVLSRLDAVGAALDAELARAKDTVSDRDAVLDQARAEAEAILAQAREDAEGLVSEHALVTEATERAEALTAEAQEEAEGLRREADAYVDGRIAELEAGLSRTLSQIQTMRARLSERSGLDERPLA